MAYLHCVPPVSCEDQFMLEGQKAILSYPRGRHGSSLTVVDLNIQTQEGNERSPSQTHHIRDSLRGKHNKAFTPSSSTRLHNQQKKVDSERWSVSASQNRQQKMFPEPAGKATQSDQRSKSQQKKGNSTSGSARTSVEKVYKPTLPKYCFSASTYQSVLTDYAAAASLGADNDISQLPPPRHTLMTRELPYVYRYKIQQGISSLNDMIPTKRSQSTEHIW